MRSNLFRTALENETVALEPGEEVMGRVVLKGPLSDAYTDALNIVYAKVPPGGTAGPGPILNEVAQESQANDEMMMQELAESIIEATGGDAEKETPTTLYGVQADSISEQDVVNVNQALYEQPEGSVVLVVDATAPGPNSPEDSLPTERIMYLRQGLECMVQAHKGRVYPSLEAYAVARRRKAK